MFIGAGFVFAPSRILVDVPYDPYLTWLFHGEEFLFVRRLLYVVVHKWHECHPSNSSLIISQSARAWTSGYDLVVPLENVVSHVYGLKKYSAYLDKPDANTIAEDARVRVRYILGMSTQRPVKDRELIEYGLGTERTMHEYEIFSGLNLSNRSIAERCKQVFAWNTRQWFPRDSPRPTLKPARELQGDEQVDIVNAGGVAAPTPLQPHATPPAIQPPAATKHQKLLPLLDSDDGASTMQDSSSHQSTLMYRRRRVSLNRIDSEPTTMQNLGKHQPEQLIV